MLLQNIAIGMLKSEGYRIIKSHFFVDDGLKEFIIKKVSTFNAEGVDYMYEKYNRLHIPTIFYTFNDDPNSRANLYGIHFITERKIINFESMVRNLGDQFHFNGFHRYNIIPLLYEGINSQIAKQENKAYSVPESKNDIHILWTGINKKGEIV